MVGLTTGARALQRQAGIILLILGATALVCALGITSQRLEDTLRDPEPLTGYALFSLCILLAALNARKRLSMLPVVRAALWTQVHWLGGVTTVAVYWLHVGVFWPTGLYEQTLAGLFYVVSITGVIGLVCQNIFPRRLTETGLEVIFEEIPHEIVSLRERAEETILACTRELGSDTLARFYVETFQWFFRRPRFLLSHLWGGQRAAFWIAQQVGTARWYLSEREIPFLNQLSEIARTKAKLDMHYAAQGLLKVWLLVHVPFAAAMMLLAIWHLFLVNAYSL